MNNIIDFVKNHDFDLIHFQEVANGHWGFGTAEDNYTVLEHNLGETYSNEIIKYMGQAQDPTAYFANVTFFKKSFSLLNKDIVWHEEYKDVTDIKTRVIKDDARAALILTLQKNDQIFYSINTHLAWGPDSKDEDYKLEQAKKLYTYTKQLDKPFILSGDFNLDPTSEVVKWFDSIGTNLVTSHNVQNTLNSRVHYAKHLFPPGLVVDYIYTSPQMKIHSFEVIENVDLADHLGLMAEIEL
jgi:endonuclease/exonuclease/phosphatase family metal-dependent hydrolase